LLAVSATAAQPVAKVQLPCESHSQDLSPTGTQLAVTCKDNSVYLVEVSDGAGRKVLTSDHPPNTHVYSQDGRWLAAGFSDGTVEVISAHDSTASRQWKAGPHRIDTLYFFPDGKRLFVGPVDSPGTVWELSETPALLATLPADFGGISVCAVSPDGKLMVAAGDDTVLRWYATATWQKTREYRDFLLETFALTFTPDGKSVLAGGADSRISVFDAASGKQVSQLPPETGSSIFYIGLLGDQNRALAVYFDNAGGKPPQALVWDLITAKSVPVTGDAPPTCGAIVKGKLWTCSSDGKMLTISQHE
jgi:WD40 repeat protein